MMCGGIKWGIVSFTVREEVCVACLSVLLPMQEHFFRNSISLKHTLIDRDSIDRDDMPLFCEFGDMLSEMPLPGARLARNSI